jgi:hypothetical protein
MGLSVLVKYATSTTIGIADDMIDGRWKLSRQAFKRRVDTHDVDRRGAEKR